METPWAFKVPVTESERGWGRKIDDYMVCLSLEDALRFTYDFNAQNTADTAPDWYMQVEDGPVRLKLTERQYQLVTAQENQRMWLRDLLAKCKESVVE